KRDWSSDVCSSDLGSLHPVLEVVDARDRDAAPAAAGALVPAVGAGVLPAVNAEAERGVEGLELMRGHHLLFGAHGVLDGVAQGVLAHDVVLEPGDQAAGLAK